MQCSLHCKTVTFYPPEVGIEIVAHGLWKKYYLNEKDEIMK
jgi:hypothetical protein